jgi:hypothetical protein
MQLVSGQLRSSKVGVILELMAAVKYEMYWRVRDCCLEGISRAPLPPLRTAITRGRKKAGPLISSENLLLSLKQNIYSG